MAMNYYTSPAATTIDTPAIVGVQLAWQANLQKIPALGGSISIPMVPVGKLSISYMIPDVSSVSWSTAFASVNFTSSLVCPFTVGTLSFVSNTYQTGGRLQTQTFGDGARSLIFTKLYTFFAG